MSTRTDTSRKADRTAARHHAEQMLRLVDTGGEPNPDEHKAFQLMILVDIADSLAELAQLADFRANGV